MDEDHDRMYVGSKDYILSLDLHDINKEPLIIHWPVSEQRRDECVLSGKDTNVSISYRPCCVGICESVY
ncbi:semaphorin-3F-like isoform X1 [Acipenser oxyrinchus oxyrinchus]|uniref:Semaphorin-3F-like isoform X1 n=1 Tax=Acipenser oxyrinchus oxyrinchus TaxID=40147 RepID=A0AAD8CV77_ACIOX|nr:semaphorin-3F-like isoform X1 [Acipenser oxyrinchus oxyrinchus]